MASVDVSALLPELLHLVRRAGQAILDVREASPRQGLDFKADRSPVTEADLAAHRIIEAGLARLTPGVPVWSEEGRADPSSMRGPLVWLVDPLDGTREFIEGSGDFTVNVALIESSRVLCGMVLVPATGELFWGGRGHGAWLDCGQGPRALKVHRPGQNDRWRVAVSKSHSNPQTEAWLARLGSIELVRVGSSLKFCRIAQAVADLYPRLGHTCQWDTAAGQAVLEGAGGQVYDFNGEPLRYGGGDVLNPDFIATSMDFADVCDRLA